MRKVKGKKNEKSKQKGKGIKVRGVRIEKATTNVEEKEKKVWNKKPIFFIFQLDY